MTTIQSIKKAIKEDKLVIGLNKTLRELKKDEVKIVVVASNAPIHVKEEIKSLTKVNDVEYVEMNKDNVELGAICRKSFGVMTLSIKK